VNRVVVTGMGVVSPLGHDYDQAFKRLMSGDSGVGPITTFDTSSCPVRTAGEVRDLVPADFDVSRRDLRILDRFQQFAVVAAEQAVRDAGLDLPRYEVSRPTPGRSRIEEIGTSIGVACSSLAVLERQVDVLRSTGTAGVSPRLFNMILPNVATSAVAIRFGLAGPPLCASTASASGADAIIAAFDQVRHGRAVAMLAGGAESAVTELVVSGFCQNWTGSRAGACRPFDINRDGTVCGEGAGVVVLENYDHAVARGARIHGEVLGYGLRSDAYDMSDIPPVDARGMIAALTEALRDSSVLPDEVDYINVHGTATRKNDQAETNAITAVFGADTPRVFVSGIKGATGHMLGGSGAVEFIVTLLAARLGQIPPSHGLLDPDPACALRHVIGTGTHAPVRVAVTSAVGMGGNNCVIAVRGQAGEDRHV
jgi:3-oxoacyl-[acyl-carrier-protein] synthase II